VPYTGCLFHSCFICFCSCQVAYTHECTTPSRTHVRALVLPPCRLLSSLLFCISYVLSNILSLSCSGSLSRSYICSVSLLFCLSLIHTLVLPLSSATVSLLFCLSLVLPLSSASLLFCLCLSFVLSLSYSGCLLF